MLYRHIWSKNEVSTLTFGEVVDPFDAVKMRQKEKVYLPLNTKS